MARMKARAEKWNKEGPSGHPRKKHTWYIIHFLHMSTLRARCVSNPTKHTAKSRLAHCWHNATHYREQPCWQLTNAVQWVNISKTLQWTALFDIGMAQHSRPRLAYHCRDRPCSLLTCSSTASRYVCTKLMYTMHRQKTVILQITMPIKFLSWISCMLENAIC